jgi:putative colanic acid biosynthesis glycosyltransferase WcaI
MRIQIVSQYFVPEITAAAGRVHAFAAGLAERGHQVEVICEVPSHPAGVVTPGYGGHFVDRRSMDGFGVSYVWVWVTPSKATRDRLVNYASFAATATIAGAARRRPDVIVASSPPLPVGNVGATLAFRHRAPWVLDVRDLWPDVALVVGEVEEGPMVNAARRIERRLYRSADAITCTTETFKGEIEARGGAGKVTRISNGTTAPFLEAADAEPDPGLLGSQGDRFTWTYAGNLGLAQGLEAAIGAARELGDGFRLVLIGEGPRKEQLRELARDLPEGSVVFRDPVPVTEVGLLLRASDALLVSLADMPGLEGFVPSKLFDCCAVGRPVVLSVAGEAAKLATDAEAALCVPPGDTAQLVEAVRRLRDDASLRDRLAAGGRRFAEENSRAKGVEHLEAVLQAVTAARR